MEIGQLPPRDYLDVPVHVINIQGDSMKESVFVQLSSNNSTVVTNDLEIYRHDKFGDRMIIITPKGFKSKKCDYTLLYLCGMGETCEKYLTFYLEKGSAK